MSIFDVGDADSESAAADESGRFLHFTNNHKNQRSMGPTPKLQVVEMIGCRNRHSITAAFRVGVPGLCVILRQFTPNCVTPGNFSRTEPRNSPKR